MSRRTVTTARPRSGSLKEALDGLEKDPRHHIASSLNPQTPLSSVPGTPRRASSPPATGSKGFWDDILTMKWMIYPSSSFKLLAIPIVLYINWQLVCPQYGNPWRRLLFVSNRVEDSEKGFPQYAKSYWDLAFLSYYIVVFSFIRQSLFLYVLNPLGRRCGISPGKLDRFAEQTYAVIYFTWSGVLGLYTMYQYLPTWYFRTEYFWIDYPHWKMPGTLKAYYLLQASYWCQQFLLLTLRMEKPRSDYKELVAHHIVTLWLIGWSYLVNLTLIGNAVYLTMDWSDIFLALSKTFNYLQMEKTKTVAFAFFTCVWTYTRHYLNIVILVSTWNEFNLIPKESMVWAPETGAWLTWWMKYQIFAPILLLQFLNLFWYFLIWRVLLRAIFSSNLDDERSDDEDEDVEPVSKSNGKNSVKVNGKQNGKANGKSKAD